MKKPNLHDLLEDVTWKGLCVPWDAEDLAEVKVRLEDVYAATAMALAAVNAEIGGERDEF